MFDLLFIVTAAAFFGISMIYTYACERLRGHHHD